MKSHFISGVDEGTGTGSVRNASSTLERYQRVLHRSKMKEQAHYDVRHAKHTLVAVIISVIIKR